MRSGYDSAYKKETVVRSDLMNIDFDKKLGISTAKAETRMDDKKEYNRYEPTPYDALMKLIRYSDIKEDDHIVDIGSGKGRTAFFLNYYTSCRVTSVEIVEEFHNQAIKNYQIYNKNTRMGRDRLFFVNQKAEDYKFSPFENKVYMFNPFSLKIFIKVINNLIESYYESKRRIELILYYPDDDCINYLEEKTLFSHVSDIYLDTFYKDGRERFSIYRLDEFFRGAEDIVYQSGFYMEYNICITTNDRLKEKTIDKKGRDI